MSKIYSKKTKKLVLEINRKSMRSVYHVEGAQGAVFKQIFFEGFTDIPKGFYREGYGLARPAGTFLLQAFKDVLGDKLKLHILKGGKSSIRISGNTFHIRLTHPEYLLILDSLRSERGEANAKCRQLTISHLSNLFPSHFKFSGRLDTAFAYAEDKLAKILNSDPQIIEKLSKTDVTRLAEIYQELVDKGKLGGSPSDILIAAKSKLRSERIYLETVVKQFEERLRKSTLNESSWQQFLQKYILLFNTSYFDVLEKASVSLGGKYPDFMLLDVYNYIDIYEIKKPTTNLLRLDESRNNYYWDVEIAKAISQVENYIHLLSQNSLAFQAEVKRSKKLEIKVVRPRGFIIAGKSVQFADDKMRDDFRLLASSLKNTDIILYDDMLQNLKNLLKRLKKG